MKMKIVALAAVLVLLVPGVNAFADHPSYNVLQEYFSHTAGGPDYYGEPFGNKMVDGNHETGVTANRTIGSNDKKIYPEIHLTEKQVGVKSIYLDLSNISDITGLNYMDIRLREGTTVKERFYVQESKFVNGSFKGLVDTSNAVNLEGVIYDNVHIVTQTTNSTVSGITEISVKINEVAILPGSFDETPPAEISGLVSSDIKHDSATFSYELPSDEDFSSVIISRNGVNIAETSEPSYTDSGLSPKNEYTYKFVTVDNMGNRSAGVTETIQTAEAPIPLGDVLNLEAEVSHDRVDLSWQLPTSNFQELAHINIYRDEITDIALIDQLLGVKYVSAAATTKIFETNGTYFNDLTVEPEKEYEYTLTTTATDETETEGVTIQIETPEEPAPQIIGGDYTKDPATGDFIYTWDEPTKGQVKVFLDGTAYKTVDSADQKIVIPAAEMKYDYLGDPLVSLQPIGTNGKLGETVETGSSVKDMALPFGPLDLLKSGNGLLMVIGGFLLLALSFLLAPKLIRMIKRALGKESEKEAAARRIKEEAKARKTERRERERREARQARQAKGTAAAPATAQGVSKAAITERQEKKLKETAQKEPRTTRERKREGRQPEATRKPRERTRAAREPRTGRR